MDQAHTRLRLILDDDMPYKQLEDLSWGYYLSDITLKRLEAEVLSSLYVQSPGNWNIDTLPSMLQRVAGFEAQLAQWWVMAT